MRIVILTIALLFVSSITSAGIITQVKEFGDNPAAIKMYHYIPEMMPETPVPLVVSLHGCKQNVNRYSKAGWVKLSEQLKFYVLFPEQVEANNKISCWNWFETGPKDKGYQEIKSIDSMIKTMIQKFNVDRNQIYIEGLSAGGYMAANLLALYPNVFAGGAINAGGASFCADNAIGAYPCMYGQVTHSPEEWVNIIQARTHHNLPETKWPIISIWHGNKDDRVYPQNQEELVKQWTKLHNIDFTKYSEEMTTQYIHREYRNSGNKVLVESYTVKGMGHGTPVDPDHGCGQVDNNILDFKVCGLERVADFWGLTEQMVLKARLENDVKKLKN